MAKFLVNTEEFSEAANDYRRNGGVYTKAPYKSREFMEYWQEQKRRCLEGFSVGGLKITGRHYFYLNFCPIKRTEKDDDPAKKGWNVMKEKELLFPRFWLVDYEWWWAKEIAMKGMLKEEVALLGLESLPIKDYTEGKHLVCVKTRRAGFSYKEAADGLYNYNFIPRSKSFFFASNSEYLTVDGILNKVETYLEHLDKNTQNFWRRNRMEKNSISDMHWKASYIDAEKKIGGFQSEILGVVVNNPNKVRGKDGVKITFEEAGSFKDLLAALAIALPSVKDGKTMTGQISVFGTGGEEGPAIEGLETLIYNPETYDMLEFRNIWDEGMESTAVGYFVPCYLANQDFMDKDGNVDVQGAKDYDDAERTKKGKTGNPKDLDRRIAEYPRNIDEALSRSSKSVFSHVELMRKHLKAVKQNKDLQSSIRHGMVVKTKEGVKFVPMPNLTPIDFYPHETKSSGDTKKDGDNLKGAVSIYYPPEKGVEYIEVVDPYYKDGAESLVSLWVTYIIRKPNKGDPEAGKIQASYIGRPTLLDTCYEISHHLSDLYNCAKIQSEIAGGGQEFFVYLKKKGLLNRICFEPIVQTSKEIVSEKNRKYFMNVTAESKRLGLSAFANWAEQVVGLTEDGEVVYRFQTWTDTGLLEECVKWKEGGNYDRISAYTIYVQMLHELEVEEKKRKEENSDPNKGNALSNLFNLAGSTRTAEENDIIESIIYGGNSIGSDILSM